MRRLSTVSTRSLLRRKGRYALTGIGIVLGVAIVFAVLATSTTTDRVLQRAVQGTAGNADVIATKVGTFDTAISTELAEELVELDGVERAAAVFEVAVSLRSDPDEGLSTSARFALYGITAADARGVHEFRFAEGRAFEGDDEVVLGPAVASGRDLVVGDRVRLAARGNERTLTVAGVLEETGAGLLGWAAYASPEVARELAGAADGVFTRVDLALRPEVDRDAWLAASRDVYAGRVLFEPASNVMGQFQTFLGGVQGALTVIAAIALFVGAFLIFLTFSVSVAERTRMYGTLRALGALPQQIRRLVVGEAAILAVVSTLVGVGLGWLLAQVSLGFVDTLLVQLPPVESLEGVVPSGLAAGGLGIGISVVSAYVPARRAGALTPIGAMRMSGAEDGHGQVWWRAVLLAAGIGLLIFGSGLTTGGLGALLVLLGAVLLLPAGLPVLARLVGAVTQRFARGVGEVGVMHLVKERSRSAYTLGLVMVVLAMILAIATANESMSASLDRVIDEQFGADLQVEGRDTVFEEEAVDELSRLDGVDRVAAFRFGVTELGEEGDSRSIFFMVIDPRAYFQVSGFAWVEGDEERAREALESGGVLLDAPTAEDLGVAPGDEVVLWTNEGRRKFRVGATYTVFGQLSGAVTSLEDGRDLFGADRPMGFFVDIAQGHDVDHVRHEIRAVLPRGEVDVYSLEETKEFARATLGGYFGIAYAILVVAAAIGILGLANTLIVSVLQRTRELGVLRSVGVLRRQLRGMVLVESATLVLVAYVLALPLGWLLAQLTVGGVAETLGFTVELVWWWPLLPTLLVIALVVGGLSAVAPARRAGRLDVIEALRFE